MVDAVLMEVATNVKAIMVKIDDIRDDVIYLTNMKNKHEERLTRMESLIPKDLDDRLRDIEKQIIKFALIMGIASTLAGILLTKIIDFLMV